MKFKFWNRLSIAASIILMFPTTYAAEVTGNQALDLSIVNHFFQDIALEAIKDSELVNNLSLIVDEEKTDLENGSVFVTATATISHSKWELDTPSNLSLTFSGNLSREKSEAVINAELTTETQIDSFLKFYARESLDQYYQASGFGPNCLGLEDASGSDGAKSRVDICSAVEKLAKTGSLDDFESLIILAQEAAQKSPDKDYFLNKVSITRAVSPSKGEEIKITYAPVNPGTEIYANVKELAAIISISEKKITAAVNVTMSLEESEIKSAEQEFELMKSWLRELSESKKDAPAYNDFLSELKRYVKYTEAYYEELDLAADLIPYLFFTINN